MINRRGQTPRPNVKHKLMGYSSGRRRRRRRRKTIPLANNYYFSIYIYVHNACVCIMRHKDSVLTYYEQTPYRAGYIQVLIQADCNTATIEVICFTVPHRNIVTVFEYRVNRAYCLRIVTLLTPGWTRLFWPEPKVKNEKHGYFARETLWKRTLGNGFRK